MLIKNKIIKNKNHTMNDLRMWQTSFDNDIEKNKTSLFALTRCFENDRRLDFKSEYGKSKIYSDDLILLLTDGVYNWISLNEITEIINNKMINFKDKSRNIINYALKNGSNDNLTCILVQC
jgi:protein phosphatase